MQAVATGHICLDIIPQFQPTRRYLRSAQAEVLQSLGHRVNWRAQACQESWVPCLYVEEVDPTANRFGPGLVVNGFDG